MLESHPIVSRLALVLMLGVGLAYTGYALTGQPIIVAESHADTPDPNAPLPLVHHEKADRLVMASVLGTASFVPNPGPLIGALVPPSHDFKAVFDTKAAPVDPDAVKTITRRVDLMGTIIKAAAQTDVDPVYLIALADKESDLSPTEDSPRSSALGLFQFVDGTWLELVKEFGPDHGLRAEAAQIRLIDGQAVAVSDAARSRILALRNDPYLSAVMAGEMVRRDSDLLAKSTGRDLTSAEAYMGHFLGRGGAEKFIEALRRAPHQSAAAAFPQAAQANPTMFYAAVGGVRRDLTIAQVYDRIARQIDERVARYTGVGAGVAKVNSPAPSVAASAPASGGPGGGILAFAP